MHYSSMHKIQKDALSSTKQNWFLAFALATHILKPQWYREGGMTPVQRGESWSVTFIKKKKNPYFYTGEMGFFLKGSR